MDDPQGAAVVARAPSTAGDVHRIKAEARKPPRRRCAGVRDSCTRSGIKHRGHRPRGAVGRRAGHPEHPIRFDAKTPLGDTTGNGVGTDVELTKLSSRHNPVLQ